MLGGSKPSLQGCSGGATWMYLHDFETPGVTTNRKAGTKAKL